jgi:heme exporter protein C
MILGWLTGILMTLAILAGFLYAPPAVGLGEVSRVIYFHVPAAWVAVLAFCLSMVNSVAYLRRRSLDLDRRSAAAAELGLVFCLIATVTGSIFAKATWGSYWNWDPRETSIFILLLIYGAYFALRTAVEDETRRAALAAVYAIIAFITVPYLVFLVPRLYLSLHPDPIINAGGKMQMDWRMRQTLLLSLTAFTGLFVWIYRLRLRIEGLSRRAEPDWSDAPEVSVITVMTSEREV